MELGNASSAALPTFQIWPCCWVSQLRLCSIIQGWSSVGWASVRE